MFFLLLIGIVLMIWRFYLEQKLTWFDDDRRVINFRNMNRVFPSNIIHRSAQPYQFHEDLRDLNVSYQFHGETRKMSDFLQRLRTMGF